MNTIEPKPCLSRSNRDPFPVLTRNGFIRSVATLALSACTLAATVLQASPPASVLTTMHSFGGSDGSLPMRGLLQASDGNFYGCTRNGGSSNHGSIFKITSGGTFSTLASFDGTTHGSSPIDLVEGPDHALYGVSFNNGVANNGTVFKITTSGTLTTLLTFTPGVNTSIGGGPAGLSFGADGFIYVVGEYGGTNNTGTIIKMNTSGSVHTKLVEFTGTDSNGTHPIGRLVQANNGNFYGCTLDGGSSASGTVFQLTTGGTLTTLVSFDGSNFANPSGSLIQASDGYLYGTTNGGGANGLGTVFKITTDASLSLVASMTTSSGEFPLGSLLEGPDHNFYGMTSVGGANDFGTIFQATPGGSIVSLVDFDSGTAPKGANSSGGLILATNGLFYGVTDAGGDNDEGTVFNVAIDVGNPASAVVASPTPIAVSGGSSYVTFGYVGAGAGAIETFRISNSGTGTLSVTSASVVGGNATDFTVDSSSMSSTVEPGSNTSFTVQFSPPIVGTFSTTLRILTNDPAHRTISIPLVGTGVPPSAITFSTPVYTVDQGAKSVNLILTRAVTTQAQTVVINTSDGTSNAFPPFDAATAGVDYTNLTGGATTVSFGIGQVSKNVPVTLSPKSGTVNNKQFTAAISSPSLNATLGAVTTTTIQILANDTTKPTLDVTAPDVSTTTLDAASNATVTVTGSADDSRGIAKVLVTANGVTVPATLGSVSGTTVQFSYTFAPILGANTLAIAASDLRGNTTSVTRNFTLTGGVALHIARTVPSGISTRPDLAGTVTVAASPARSVGPLTPTTANANPKTCLAIPTSQIRLTANAYVGYAFSGWSGLPDGAVTAGNVTTITMPSDPLTVTATYVVAPFTPPTGTSTSFYGLISATGGASPTIYTEGYIAGILLSSTGAFSGQVNIDGISQAINATFFGDGSSTFVVGGVPTSTLTFGGRTLTLSYNAGAGNNQITVTTAKSGITSTAVAQRGYYSSTRKVSSSLLNLTTSGTFTFTLPTQEQNPTADHATYPQGDGIGTITLSSTGLVTIAGTLADGIAFTASSAMVDSQSCPFFVQLTTPAAATKLGAFGGVLVFDPNQNDTDVSATNLEWFRPAASGSALYTAGWPGGINVGLVGSLYASSHTAQTTLGLGSVGSSGNAMIVFSDGKLFPTITDTLFNISGNTVSYLSGLGSNLSLVIGAGGNFSGTFTPNWSSPSSVKPAFKGVMLQKAASQGGYGFFISNKLSDAHPQSGGVTLSGQ